MCRSLVVLLLCLLALPALAEEAECPIDMSKTVVEYESPHPGLGYSKFTPLRNSGRKAGFSVHVVRLALADPFAVRVLRLRTGDMRVEKLVKAVQKAGPKIAAAINGDYFSAFEEGKHPLGLHISGGQMLREPSGTTTFAVGADGSLQMAAPQLSANAMVGGITLPISVFNQLAPRNGTALYFGRLEEAVLPQSKCRTIVLSTDGNSFVNHPVAATVTRTLPKARKLELSYTESALVVCDKELVELPPVGDEVILELTLKGLSGPIIEAISGGPRILRAGEVVFEGKAEGFPMWRRGYISGTHPRTALGLDSAGATLYMLVAEGRPGGLDAGGTACVLKGLGATDAMLLDGGGSSVMVWDGRIVNRPHAALQRTSRRVANALAIIFVAGESD